MALKYGGEELVRPDAQEPLPVLSEDLVRMVEDVLERKIETPLDIKGFLPDLTEGGEITPVTFEIPFNGEQREGLGWRIDSLQLIVDKEFVDSRYPFRTGGYKEPGETIVPNLELSDAKEVVGRLGDAIHAINLGVLDRRRYDPDWHEKFLEYLRQNPNTSYEFRGGMPTGEGSEKVGVLGRVDPHRPVVVYILPPKLELNEAAWGKYKIYGGSDKAPYSLPYMERNDGYFGMDIDSEETLRIFVSPFFFGNSLGNAENDGNPDIYFAFKGASRKERYRSAMVNFGPGSQSEKAIAKSLYNGGNLHLVWK
jgi:hypothetical protein